MVAPLNLTMNLSSVPALIIGLMALALFAGYINQIEVEYILLLIAAPFILMELMAVAKILYDGWNLPN